MADLRWQTRYLGLLALIETWHMGVFRMVEYKSVISFKEFNMADPIWWDKYFDFLD